MVKKIYYCNKLELIKNIDVEILNQISKNKIRK